jgi:sigma-B regulation protein RsbU (phosphoserine phosphatase)
LLVIAGVVMGLTLRRIYDSAVVTMQQQHMREVDLLATNLNEELIALSNIVNGTAAFLSLQPGLDQQALYSMLSQSVQRNPLIYGAAAAFEPFAFHDELRLFAPYVFDTDLKQLDISSVSGDYSAGDTPWYQSVKGLGRAAWSEPYFDTGAGTMPIVTYSVPMYIEGAFVGVTTLDLRLDRLSRQIASRLDSARFMIMSPAGRFISHYDPDFTLNADLGELAATSTDASFQDITRQILAGETGMGVVNDLSLDGTAIPGNTWISYAPIPSTGWFLATLASESALIAPIREQIQIALLGLSLTILLIFLLVWWMSGRITKPIKTLESAVSDVARGRLDTHIENIRSMDELGRLSIGFNRMLKNLKKQIELQSQQETAQRVVERELQMARETQRSLLPTEFPPFPDHKEFELHAVNQAAHHVAGDFFDFFLINPKTLVFVIADVSGKGMSAALVMAVTRTIVRDLAQSGRNPGEILHETNERLRESQKGGAFVTIFLGSYNVSTGRVIYANGGHLPPFLLSKSGQITNVGEATGTIVGMLENQEYRAAEFTLKPGETLLLYTDGFPEARSPAGEFFGNGRIKSFLHKHSEASVKELCEAAIADIGSYQNQNLADDITLLALKRTTFGVSSLFNDFLKTRPVQG